MMHEVRSSRAAAVSYVFPAFVAVMSGHAASASHTYVSTEVFDEVMHQNYAVPTGGFRSLAGSIVAQPAITKSRKFIGQQSPWVVTDESFTASQTAPWLQLVSREISRFCSVSDGWKGDNSVAPTAVAIDEALEMAVQLAAELPGIPTPLVGADADGYFCFYWNENDVMANLSIYGDGTYSFYAQNDFEHAEADEEIVGMPLPDRLLRVLSSIQAT